MTGSGRSRWSRSWSVSLSAALFVRRQRRLAEPLIDLGLFRVRAFSASLAVYTLGILVLFGSSSSSTSTCSSCRALAARAGLGRCRLRRLRPRIDAGAHARQARRTGDAHGRRPPALRRRLRADDAGRRRLRRWSSSSLRRSFSLGLAPLFTVTNDLIIGSAPPERAGAASGISETGAELGGALASRCSDARHRRLSRPAGGLDPLGSLARPGRRRELDARWRARGEREPASVGRRDAARRRARGLYRRPAGDCPRERRHCGRRRRARRDPPARGVDGGGASGRRWRRGRARDASGVERLSQQRRSR